MPRLEDAGGDATTLTMLAAKEAAFDLAKKTGCSLG
jgi:hypothetical protein